MAGYFGNKGVEGLYQAIINIMPPHRTYIEPFLGSGQIMRRKPPAELSIGLDLDEQLIDISDYTAANLGESDYRNQEIDLICGNGIRFIKSYPCDDHVLIYCDPPYPHSTRSKIRYKHDMTDNDHIALLKTLLNINAKIIISTYPNQIYDEHLSNWNHFELQTSTRGGVRTEQVWFNYDLGQVHFHKYAGKNATDRQRIKRKAERWQKKFQKLPPQERQAILAELLQCR